MIKFYKDTLCQLQWTKDSREFVEDIFCLLKAVTGRDNVTEEDIHFLAMPYADCASNGNKPPTEVSEAVLECLSKWAVEVKEMELFPESTNLSSRNIETVMAQIKKDIFQLHQAANREGMLLQTSLPTLYATAEVAVKTKHQTDTPGPSL